MTTHYTSQNFSIVIPIYNEEEILESSFNEIASICEKTGIKYEIILVENGSTDKTKEIADVTLSFTFFPSDYYKKNKI